MDLKGNCQGTEKLLGQAVFKLWIKTIKIFF